MKQARFAIALLGVASVCGSPAKAQYVTATIAAGFSPEATAVNPVTNKVYIANINGGTVTVIDGATNATSTVAAGTFPVAIAINPATNKIYVAN